MVLGNAVRDYAADGPAKTGKDADAGSDYRGSKKIDFLREKLLHGEPEALDGILHRFNFFPCALLGCFKQLGDGEQADECRQQADSPVQLLDAKGETREGCDGGHADEGESKTQESTEQAFDQRFARHGGNEGEAEDSDGKVFKRGEVQRYFSHQRGDEIEDQQAEDATKE